MDEEDNLNNVNTAGKDQEERQQDKQPGSKAQKAKNAYNKAKNAKKLADKAKEIKAVSSVMSALGPIIVPIIVIILAIILIIGLIGFLTSLPGLYIENIKEFATSLWGNVSGFFSGDNITPTVTEEDQIELAQRIQDMGYDIVAYGFADAKYNLDDSTEIDAGEVDGIQNGEIVSINKSIDGRNYLQAYIAQSEATYALSKWSFAGFFKSIVDFWDSDGESKEARAFSKGMININVPDNLYYPETLKYEVNRETKALRISYLGEKYYYNMSNWTAKYGKPIEMFLSLHLATMMPDLTYDLATERCFNTKINIELQELDVEYKVIYQKTSGEEIFQNEIERIYLKSFWGMSDAQIDLFEQAGKLDEAFRRIVQSSDRFTGEYDKNNDYKPITTLIGGYKGFNLSDLERELLGQRHSSEVVTIRERVDDENNNDNDENEDNENNEDNGDNEEEQNNEEEYVEISVEVDLVLRYNENAESVQNIINSTNLNGVTVEQMQKLKDLIINNKTVTMMPRITTVDNHWYYEYINFKYGRARQAKKRATYSTEDEDSPLSSSNLNGGKIILDQTLTPRNSGESVYYQLCEPETDGPNDAIVALFKGGSGNFNSEDYDFEGKYYRYDGTRKTAQIIANAKARDEGKSKYKFQNEEYTVIESEDNPDWNIEKVPVTFSNVDENGEESFSDALSAFAILENMHTEEAEFVYRNLRDLLIKLNYFTRDDFMTPLTQVLLWPIKDVTEDKGIKQEDNLFGITLEHGVAFVPGNLVVAPGDATVEKVDSHSVTLKFKTISDDVAQKLQEQFGNKYKEVQKDIILDMEMTISGFTPNVSVGQTVTVGQTIGTAGNEDIRILLYNIDKSLVENIYDYMYPTYEKQDIFEDESNNNDHANAGDWFDPEIDLGEITDVEPYVYQYLRNSGFTKEGACAVMGIIKAESGFNPNAENPNDGGFGLIQWTYGRRTNLENWCAQNGLDYRTKEAQMKFFVYELQAVYSNSAGYAYPVYETLVSSNDLSYCVEMFFCHAEAGTNVEITPEGEYAPGTGSTQEMFDKRLSYATAYYNQMGD